MDMASDEKFPITRKQVTFFSTKIYSDEIFSDKVSAFTNKTSWLFSPESK